MGALEMLMLVTVIAAPLVGLLLVVRLLRRRGERRK
jgi:hypothetical protein